MHLYNTVLPEVSVQDKTGFVYTFGLCHVVEIMLDKVEYIGCASLYLELIKAHRHVLFPDIIGSNVSAELLYLIKRSSHAVAGKLILAVGMLTGELI